jgi:hypothetical protein
MNQYLRWLVVAVLLFFSWKGASLNLHWPPHDEAVEAPKPEKEASEWCAAVRPIAAKMLPGDRVYLANLYEAMGHILKRDFSRDQPIIKTSDDFVTFHSGTLRLAIDKASVGKYPGLAEAIDQAFLAAMGADPKPLDSVAQARLLSACSAMSWAIGIGFDE